MEDPSAPQPSDPALTKEQEAMGTAPGAVGQPQEIPGAVPPAYYALPGGAAGQVSYVPASVGQPFPGGQIAYIPGSAQPVTIMVSYENFPPQHINTHTLVCIFLV